MLLFRDMQGIRKLDKRQIVIAFVTCFSLLATFSSGLAVPGPLPETQGQEIAAEKGARHPEKGIHPYRKEHMTQILSRYHTGLHPEYDEKLVAFISEESRKYGFEPELILALITTESSFYNWSVSNKGAVGMMQIIPETGKAMAKVNQIAWNEQNHRLFDPYVNIRLGIHYLHVLNKRFGDIRIALAAYNFGPTKVQRWIRKGRRIPTRYANKVLRFYRNYQASHKKHIQMREAATNAAAGIPSASDT